MIPTRSLRFILRRTVGLSLAAALFVAFAPPADAQGFGPDPFRPYNSQYDAYVFGVAPGALDGVGNPSLNRAGVRNANQFQSAMNEFGERANGNRYDRANRDFDREYNRVYRPNAKADARFENQRSEISDIYFRYLREKDPRKRAALLKEYNQAQSKASRELATSPNARGARRRPSAAVPPPPGLGEDLPRRSPAATPPPPPLTRDDDPASSAPTAGRREPRRPAAPDAAPAESTPSEVLERATRRPSGTIPPPPLP